MREIDGMIDFQTETWTVPAAPVLRFPYFRNCGFFRPEYSDEEVSKVKTLQPKLLDRCHTLKKEITIWAFQSNTKC